MINVILLKKNLYPVLEKIENVLILRKVFNIINEFIILNMTSTTSLSDLPISPQSEENVQMQMSEKNVVVENNMNNIQSQRENELKNIQSSQIPNIPKAIEGADLNKFVTGIQDAAASGALNLPARDIPQSQNHITQDEQIKANFVPPQSNTDYIGEGQTNDEIIRQNAAKTQEKDSLDQMYDNIQTPLLLAVLYFIFQLPVVKKNLFKIIPSLFKKDGQYNLIGYLVTSCAFAAVYVSVTQSVQYFSI